LHYEKYKLYMSINLLPQELRPKTYAIKLSKSLRKIANVGLVVLFIAIAIIGGVYGFLTYRSRTIVSNGDKVTRDIKTLESTEQKLVLVQDRLNKVNTVLGAQNASDTASIFYEVSKALPEGVVISESKLDSTYANITIMANSSMLISKFISELTSLGYKNIMLKSFGFDKEIGYRVEVSVAR
jgi:hypothetical protein